MQITPPENPTPKTPALLLDPPQAAAALSISERKLWELKADGEIPHLKIGSLVRYPVDGLKAWIAAQSKGGESE